jgi:hypothetical protein
MTALVEESVLIYLHRKAAKKYTSLPCCEQNLTACLLPQADQTVHVGFEL